jgi:hypothetical protein
MIETGRILQDRYQIDRQIGQGGMGAVYIATDRRFSSTVAIKETLCMDDNYRKAIEREARLLNSLKHAALPRVSDHFIENNGQFLVMEYIPGEDVACILEEKGEPFPVDQVLIWADQLLDALEFLHSQENPVIHRDIKPQNLKITARGQIILLDFGLAKGNPTDAGNKTAAKSIFGYSRNYASLEQIQGTGTDPRSDLYSLAATLYHMLTNQAPEDALTRAMAMLSNRPDPLIPANALVEGIPAGVAGILQNALDLNAEKRPSSAGQMREMLEDYEKYEHLAVAGAPVSMPMDADFSNQKTRLIHDATTPGVDRQTDVRTELFSDQRSEVTALRPLKTAKGDRPATNGEGDRFVPAPRRRRLTYAVLGTLLLCTSVGGAVLLFSSEYTGYSVPDANAVMPEVEDPMIDEPVADIRTSASDPSAGNANSDAKQPVQETASTQKRSTSPNSKNATPPDTPAAPNVPGKGDYDFEEGDVKIKGDTVWVGNMKVDGVKVERPGASVNHNGTTPKVRPAAPILPPNFPFLTPEQRRRLRIYQRRNANANSEPQ